MNRCAIGRSATLRVAAGSQTRKTVDDFNAARRVDVLQVTDARSGQSQRDCGLQPKVGVDLPWVRVRRWKQRQRRCERSGGTEWPQPRCSWACFVDDDPG